MECVDLLSASGKELMNLIGAARAPSPLGNRRPKGRASRLAYDEKGVLIAALRPADDQDITAYKVRPLNISSTGIAFLHGAFVYPGTSCSVIARMTDGTPCQLTGHVVRCRMIHGRVHEIGVRFNEAIDLSELIEGAANEEVEQPEGPIVPLSEQGVILKKEPKKPADPEPTNEAEGVEAPRDANADDAPGAETTEPKPGAASSDAA